MIEQHHQQLISGRRLFRCIALMILLGLLGTSLASAQSLQIKLFFSQPDAAFSDCGAVGSASRKIPPTKQVAGAALKLLFAGPTAEEKAKGMQSIEKLDSFFIGVTIKKHQAIVNFRPGAEKYLYVSGPLCQSQMILAPIEKTLLQFSNIKTVDYAINGKIIEDWDA